METALIFYALSCIAVGIILMDIVHDAIDLGYEPTNWDYFWLVISILIPVVAIVAMFAVYTTNVNNIDKD